MDAAVGANEPSTYRGGGYAQCIKQKGELPFWLRGSLVLEEVVYSGDCPQ